MRLGACGFLKVTFSSGGEGAVTAPPMVHSEAGGSEAEPGGDISLGTRLGSNQWITIKGRLRPECYFLAVG